MDKLLNEVVAVRFFKGDRKRIKAYMKVHHGRFENVSHFVRCAVIFFERELDKKQKVKP